MPTFNRDAVRRGAEEIERATQSRKSGGGLGGFAPSIYWKDDKEEKFLLFLNPIDDVPRLDMINFIPVKNDKGEVMFQASVIARTDPSIGEDEDELVKEWDAPIKDSNLFVAVELEPVMTEKRGRMRPTGFSVKVVEFERRIRDDEGNLTEETEEVTAPAYGFVQESASNFGAVVSAFDASEAPIHETPVKIQRLGKDQNTKYTLAGYPDQEVDLSAFVEYLEGISYLQDELDDVKEAIDGLDPLEAAHAVALVLLEKRLNELADDDRYKRLADGVDETLDKFGSKKKKQQGGKATAKPRASQRKKSEEDAPAEEPKATVKKKQQSPEALSALANLRKEAEARRSAK